MLINLDTAATTKNLFSHSDKMFIANPNSPYNQGVVMAKDIDVCKEKCMLDLGLHSGRLFFGPCASQLVSLLYNRIMAVSKKKPNIVAGDFEHNCVYNIETKKFHANRKIFRFLMLVNNVTGYMPSHDTFCGIAREVRNSGGFFISDFTSAIGRVALPDKMEDYLDCFFCSAHKFYGPKGAGMIWLSDRLAEYLKIEKDDDLVPGTPDVSRIRSMTDALGFAMTNGQNMVETSKAMLKVFIDELDKCGLTYRMIKPNDVYSISAWYLPFIDSADSLVRFLAEKEILVSPAHSACEEQGNYRVLKSFGFDNKVAEKTIRISLGVYSTTSDMVKLTQEIKEYKDLFC